jgi:hypothetical protein
MRDETNQPNDIRLLHCRFQELQRQAEIQPGSAALVWTRIPCKKEFVPQLSELGQLDDHVLVEGGLLVAHCGQFFLHEVYRHLNEHLRYMWVYACTFGDNATAVEGKRGTSKWEPVVLLSKGEWMKQGLGTTDEEEQHRPQPSLVEYFLRQFTAPGDLVIDPCGGDFAMAVACYRQGRRFLGCDMDEARVAAGHRRLSEEQGK